MTSLLYRTLLVAVCIKQGKLQSNIVLSLSKEIVPENTSVTLTCSKTTGSLGSVKWITSMEGSLGACGDSGDTCRKFGFLSNNLLYDCICNDGTISLLLKSVDRYQHGATWRCEDIQSASNTVVINVSVPVTHAVLKESSNRPINENATTKFTCSTSYSLPPALIRWYRRNESSTVEIRTDTDSSVHLKRGIFKRDDNLISVVETLSFRVSRSIHGWNVYCNVSSVNSNLVTSNRISLSVIFPPDRPPVIHQFSNGSTYKVIETKLANLSCSVEGGNPLGKPKWLCKDIINTELEEITTDNRTVTTSLSWTTGRDQGKTCICQTDHVLSQDIVSVNIDVLYQPNVPTIQFQYDNDKKNVTIRAKLIENKSYSVSCSADGNPVPKIYFWGGPRIIEKATNGTIDLPNVQRGDIGTYSCKAQNIMEPTYGENETAQNNTSVHVDVLYEPTIAELDNQNIAEGSSLNITCRVISANPNKTGYIWTSDKHELNIASAALILQNVSKHDSMNYTCTVKNYMTPTVGETEEGTDSETFNLNVWYGASVKKFHIRGHENENPIISNESSRIKFTCEMDSNPISTVAINSPNGKILHLSNINIIEYTYLLSSCLDSGIYSCSGSNAYNSGQQASADISLLVNCKPMAYSSVQEDVRSRLYVPVTLQFTAIAYPEPEFTWEVWTNSSWEKLTNKSINFIVSSGMQSNLTINNFTSKEVNFFRLTVENFVGKLVQNYTLQPFARPSNPTELNHIQRLLTESSVTLIWKPGFNGGTTQQFSIRYKSVIDQEWNTILLQDTGEALMSLTVHGLTSSTYYEFVIVASNIKGSSARLILRVETEAVEIFTERSTSSVGFIAGCCVGVVAIAVGIVFSIFVYRKRKTGKGDRESESTSNVKSYEDVSEMTTIADGRIPHTKQSVYEDIRPRKDRGIIERKENAYEQLRPNEGTLSETVKPDIEELKEERDENGSSIPIYTNLKL